MYVTNSGAIYQYGELEIDGEMKLQGYFYNYGATKADILSDGNNLNLNCYAGSLLQIGALQRVTNANINTYSHSIITIGAVHTTSSTSNDLYNIKFNNPDNTDYALVIWGPKNGEDTIVFDEYRQIRFNNKIENYCATKSEENNAKYTNDYCTNSAFWGYGRVNDIPSTDYN